MLALLLVLVASLLGCAAAARVHAPLDAWGRAGLGLAIGQALLVLVPFALSLVLAGNTHAGAAAALALLGAGALVVAVRSVRAAGGPRGWLRARRATAVAALREDPAGPAIAATTGALALLFAWLLHTHYLRPSDDGWHSAAVTWGDLTLHLALVTSFLERGNLPPTHPFMLDAPLGYPFLPDHSVAVLASLGLSLRAAFIVGGFVPLLALALLVQALARRLTGVRGPLVPTLAAGLFFLGGGGLGGLEVVRAAVRARSVSEALHTVDATYQPPAVLNVNVVGNLLLAARGSGYGLAIGAAAVLLLAGATVPTERRVARRDLALAGLLLGALPLIHAHSFVAVAGAVAGYLLLARGVGLRRWAWLAVPAALVALPQVVWIFTQLRSAGPAARPMLGFLRPAESLDGWVTDLVRNLGAALVVWPLAWWRATPEVRRATAPLLLLFALVNLWTFTPLPYENTKLMAWVSLAGAVLVADLLTRLARPTQPGRRPLPLVAAALFVALTWSGALSVTHQAVATTGFLDADALALAERVRVRTAHDAVILTGTTLHHPVALLGGRRVLLCSPHVLATHGLETGARLDEVRTLWRGGPAAEALLARFDVAAVTIGPPERRELPDLDEPFFAARARAVERVGPWTLYLLR